MTELEVTQGDHFNFIGTVYASGLAVDITNASLTFSVKKKFREDNYAFQRKNTAAGGSDAEIETLTGISGVFKVKGVPDNTSDLNNGEYQYDTEMVLDGATGTIAQDVFKIKPGVT